MDILLVCAVNENGDEYTHPAHERMVDHLNVDKMYVKKRMPTELLKNSVLGDFSIEIDYNSKTQQEYDFVILESPAAIIAAKRIRQKFNCPFLFVSSDWIFWPDLAHDFEREKNRLTSYLMETERELKARNSIRYLREYVDGIISMSSLFDQMLNEIINLPSYVVNPSIDPDKYDILKSINIDLTSNDALFIGKNRNHKGVDILVEAWSQINMDATLKIAGSGHPSSFGQKRNVELLGYVSQDQLYDEIKRSGIYLHTARIDCNPVSALEAMCAGLPAIVSDKTGTKTELEKIDNRLVTSPNVAKIRESIQQILNTDIDERRELSQKCQNIGRKYTKENSQKEMNNALEKMNKSF
jgi:glycosyltransferase involved in cell wall biosynthesis